MLGAVIESGKVLLSTKNVNFENIKITDSFCFRQVPDLVNFALKALGAVLKPAKG